MRSGFLVRSFVAVGVILGALLGVVPVAWGEEVRERLVLSVAPPLDERRLADALAVYLEGFDVQIERSVAAGTGDGNLRALLDELERTGQGARALATVRVTPGAAGQAEIVLVDLLTGKALVTSVPRPRRDEDLIRTVALKVQALLRSTLSEAPERLEDRPSLLRLTGAGSSAGGGSDVMTPARLFMETAYAATVAGTGLWQHGVAATAGWRPSERWELRLGVAALTALSAEANGVAVTLSRIPLRLAAQVRWPGRRFEMLAGPEVMGALSGVTASSTELPVRSGRSIAAAVGAGVQGRARLGRAAWFYLRGAALGLLVADRYSVQGQPVLALGPVQVDVEVGMGADVW